MENKTACRECPFRRESAPGYLGASSHDPHGYLDQHWHGFVRLPCHMKINWEASDTLRQTLSAPLCQGFLILCKNACKLPLNREIALAVVDTEPNQKDIFVNAYQFYQHHGED